MTLSQVDAMGMVVPGGEEARHELLRLLYFEPFVHQLPGWRMPLAWLGAKDAFFFLRHEGQLLGAWSSPPEGEVAWLRLFAVAAPLGPEEFWQAAWPMVKERLRARGVRWLYTIPYKDWFRRLLEVHGFVLTTEVRILAWQRQWLPAQRGVPGVWLRPAALEDIPAMLAVDLAAFPLPWRMSREDMVTALHEAVVATVAEDDEGVVGLHICSPSPLGGHLARLAVHPRAQGRGIGYLLVRDALQHFAARGAERVTVNTWAENRPALALYQKMGFRFTGERYPVYVLPLEG